MAAAAGKKWYQNKETEIDQKQIFALVTNQKATCQLKMNIHWQEVTH